MCIRLQQLRKQLAFHHLLLKAGQRSKMSHGEQMQRQGIMSYVYIVTNIWNSDPWLWILEVVATYTNTKVGLLVFISELRTLWAFEEGLKKTYIEAAHFKLLTSGNYRSMSNLVGTSIKQPRQNLERVCCLKTVRRSSVIKGCGPC